MIIGDVITLIDHDAAVVPSVGEIDPTEWLAGFDDMFDEVAAPAFSRREPTLTARAYLLGPAITSRPPACTIRQA